MNVTKDLQEVWLPTDLQNRGTYCYAEYQNSAAV